MMVLQILAVTESQSCWYTYLQTFTPLHFKKKMFSQADIYKNQGSGQENREKVKLGSICNRHVN